MEYQTRAQSSPAIDAGLRQYMLSVYNYMASGLALTGLVAYMLFQATAVMGPTGEIVGLTNLGVTLYTGPMMWVVALAPLGIVKPERLANCSNRSLSLASSIASQDVPAICKCRPNFSNNGNLLSSG